jgi:hypothetical protein
MNVSPAAAALLDLGAAVDAEEAIRAGLAMSAHPAAPRTLATALALQVLPPRRPAAPPPPPRPPLRRGGGRAWACLCGPGETLKKTKEGRDVSSQYRRE